MHELSIALNILNSLQQYVDENNIKNLTEIVLRIGKMQAVVPESLGFMYDTAKSEFPFAKNSILKMNFVDIKARCPQCKEEFILETINLICPNNEKHVLEIIQGNELIIESIEVEKEEQIKK